MDTLTLKPLFTSSCFIKPPRYYPFFKFNKTARVYCQITPSPCPQNPKTSKQNHFSNWVVPVLQRVKLLASSQKRKWVSPLQACSDESEKSMNESCSGNEYLQNGAFGLALLSITSHAKVRISPFLAILAANPTFISGFVAWFVAQSMKVFLNFCVERKWDLRMLFACGGMPSSHSALCTAFTTSVALCHGVADSLFPVCLGFSLIVMYDAIGVRRHAGMQAEVLNMIVADLFQGHPISQRKLKELLGYTPSQVFAGAVLWDFCRLCMLSGLLNHSIEHEFQGRFCCDLVTTPCCTIPAICIECLAN